LIVYNYAMESSLIIKGKKFISSRRGAELTGYTMDYIGQLCRAGKLDSQMIGRVRFVEEGSLLRHQSGNEKRHKTKDQFQESIVGFFQIYRTKYPIRKTTITSKPSSSTDQAVTSTVENEIKLSVKGTRSPFIDLEIFPRDISKFQSVGTVFLISILFAGSYIAIKTDSFSSAGRELSYQTSTLLDTLRFRVRNTESVFQKAGLVYADTFLSMAEASKSSFASVGNGVAKVAISSALGLSRAGALALNWHLSFVDASSQSLSSIFSSAYQIFASVFSATGRGFVSFAYELSNAYEQAINRVAIQTHSLAAVVMDLHDASVSRLATVLSFGVSFLPSDAIQAFPAAVARSGHELGHKASVVAGDMQRKVARALDFGQSVGSTMTATATRGLSVLFNLSSQPQKQTAPVIAEAPKIRKFEPKSAAVMLPSDNLSIIASDLYLRLKLAQVDIFDVLNNTVSEFAAMPRHLFSLVDDFSKRVLLGFETSLSSVTFSANALRNRIDLTGLQLGERIRTGIGSGSVAVIRMTDSVGNRVRSVANASFGFTDSSGQKIAEMLLTQVESLASRVEAVGIGLSQSVNRGANLAVSAWQYGGSAAREEVLLAFSRSSEALQKVGLNLRIVLDRLALDWQFYGLSLSLETRDLLERLALGVYRQTVMLFSPETYRTLVAGLFPLSPGSASQPTAATLSQPSLVDGHLGIAVVSKTDRISPETVKAQIRETFSDDVEVFPDESGTAGIIKPVFNRLSDDEYIYVLVPVKH